MRALYIHISGLAGLLVFLKEVLNYAPLERTILVSATTGLTVYLMLIVGHTIVRRIMAYSPPADSTSNGSSSASQSAQANSAAVAQQAVAQQAGALPEETPSDATAAPDASSTAGAEAPRSSPPSAAPSDPDASGEAPPTEASESAPDRAPQPDPQAAESSDSMAQTTA
jgi:predicted lipid-binding transport protein (Tim44 family)